MGKVNLKRIQVYPLVGLNRGFQELNDDHYKHWYDNLPDELYEYDEIENAKLYLITSFYYNFPDLVIVKGVLFPMSFEEFRIVNKQLDVAFDSLVRGYGIVKCEIKQGRIMMERHKNPIPEGIEVIFSDKKYWGL